MPNYKTPRHGVSLSEALHEAAAIAPITRAILHTFELYHPVGTPTGPVYVVNDYETFPAMKESSAARDASNVVDFLPCRVAIERPEESDTAATPEVALTIDNVSGLMSDALRLARGSIEPWEVIERIYASDDSTGPAVLPPLSLLVVGVEIVIGVGGGDSVILRCSYGDPANVSIPRVTFKRSEYPGLVR